MSTSARPFRHPGRRPWAKGTLAFALLSVGSLGAAEAATISWKGHTWQVTSGGMAGVCQGDPKNVTVDGDGFLHLRIANSGGTWTSSELFTTDRLGLGTYQWQVDGPVDTLDKNVVLGLFPYGPAAAVGTDGTNEIDIEYSRWGQTNGPNGDWTDYPASGTTIGELSYTFSLGGMTLSTSRFTWSSSSITDALLTGLPPVGDSTGLLKSWTYAPSMPSVNVPQQPLPLGMNLWCFDAPPSDSRPVEIVIRDFAFVPAGGGGAGGTAGGGGDGAGKGGAIGAAGGRPAGGAGGRPTGAGGGASPGTGGTSGSGGDAAGATGGSGVDGAGGQPSDSGTPDTSSGGDRAPSGGSGGVGDQRGSASTASGCACAATPSSREHAWFAFLMIAGILGRASKRARPAPSRNTAPPIDGAVNKPDRRGQL